MAVEPKDTKLHITIIFLFSLIYKYCYFFFYFKFYSQKKAKCEDMNVKSPITFNSEWQFLKEVVQWLLK